MRGRSNTALQEPDLHARLEDVIQSGTPTVFESLDSQTTFGVTVGRRAYESTKPLQTFLSKLMGSTPKLVELVCTQNCEPDGTSGTGDALQPPQPPQQQAGT